jgi:hypothetical protein
MRAIVLLVVLYNRYFVQYILIDIGINIIVNRINTIGIRNLVSFNQSNI